MWADHFKDKIKMNFLATSREIFPRIFWVEKLLNLIKRALRKFSVVEVFKDFKIYEYFSQGEKEPEVTGNVESIAYSITIIIF